MELCGWLKSLTPQEELAEFMACRGSVLSHVNKDFESALVAFAHSARLRPGSAQCVDRVRSTLAEMYTKIVAAYPGAYRPLSRGWMPRPETSADSATCRPGQMAPTLRPAGCRGGRRKPAVPPILPKSSGSTKKTGVTWNA